MGGAAAQGKREQRPFWAPNTPRRPPDAPCCHLEPCSRLPQPHARIPWRRGQTPRRPPHRWREQPFLRMSLAAPRPQPGPCPSLRPSKRLPPSIAGQRRAWNASSCSPPAGTPPAEFSSAARRGHSTPTPPSRAPSPSPPSLTLHRYIASRCSSLLQAQFKTSTTAPWGCSGTLKCQTIR